MVPVILFISFDSSLLTLSFGHVNIHQISLTALSGDPDLYVNTGLDDEMPMPINADWIGGALGEPTFCSPISGCVHCLL